MEDRRLPAWLYALNDQELNFLKNFLTHSGSLKDMAAIYSLSYPTLRLRLDRLIDKVRTADQKKPSAFEDLLKELTFQQKLDVGDAHRLLDLYENDLQEARDGRGES